MSKQIFRQTILLLFFFVNRHCGAIIKNSLIIHEWIRVYKCTHLFGFLPSSFRYTMFTLQSPYTSPKIKAFYLIKKCRNSSIYIVIYIYIPTSETGPSDQRYCIIIPSALADVYTRSRHTHIRLDLPTRSQSSLGYRLVTSLTRIRICTYIPICYYRARPRMRNSWHDTIYI